MGKSMTNFNKLSEDRQVEIIKQFISTLPLEEQEAVTKDLLG